MQVIKLGFTIKHEVLEISSIKPGGSGKMENGVEYSASVKFRSVNITEDDFEGTFKETEQIIEYNIPCENNSQAVQVTDVLRKLRASNTPVYVNSPIPKLYQGSQVFNAKSIDKAEAFMLNNGVKETKKAS